nr:spidroin-1-like [Aegilops tauschii subsp. strangulata]
MATAARGCSSSRAAAAGRGGQGRGGTAGEQRSGRGGGQTRAAGARQERANDTGGGYAGDCGRASSRAATGARQPSARAARAGRRERERGAEEKVGGRRCTLHFKYNGAAILFVRVFGEDGRRAGCCPEDNDGDEVLGLGEGRDEEEGELALGDGRGSSRDGSSSSGESSSSGGYDQPPVVGLASRMVAGRPVATPK